MDNQTYAPIYGLITGVTRQERNLFVSLKTENGPVNFIVTPDTFIVDQMKLKPGMYVVMFYNATLPIPLIYPPQYQAVAVAPWYADEFVLMDYFDQNLLAVSGDLKLNLSRETSIVDANGRPFRGNLANHLLIVYYTVTTRSIPPQTTPHTIIVVN